MRNLLLLNVLGRFLSHLVLLLQLFIDVRLTRPVSITYLLTYLLTYLFTPSGQIVKQPIPPQFTTNTMLKLSFSGSHFKIYSHRTLQRFV